MDSGAFSWNFVEVVDVYGFWCIVVDGGGFVGFVDFCGFCGFVDFVDFCGSWWVLVDFGGLL